MRACVARRGAAVASLTLFVVAPAEARLPGGGADTGSAEPINTVSPSTLAEGQIAAPIHYKLLQLGRPRPNADVVGDARPADGSRTAVERRFRLSDTDRNAALKIYGGRESNA